VAVSHIAGSVIEYSADRHLAELVQEVETLRAANSKLQASYASQRALTSYYKRKSAVLDGELRAQRLHNLDGGFFALVKRQRTKEEGPGKWRKLSVAGGYKLAYKRNIAHISCSGLSKVLDLDLTRQCCSIWEKALADNLVFQMKDWCRNVSNAAQHKARGRFHWKLTTIRADATNSSTLQSHKVHNCEVSVAMSFILDEGADVDELGLAGIDLQPGHYVSHTHV
jgi:hypothetical protein